MLIEIIPKSKKTTSKKTASKKTASEPHKRFYEPHMRFIDGEYQDKKGFYAGDGDGDCNCMFGCSKCGWRI